MCVCVSVCVCMLLFILSMHLMLLCSRSVVKLNHVCQCVIYLTVAFFVINSIFSVIEALLNPILSSNFGLNIEYISYVFTSTVSLFSIATAIM